MAAPLQVKAMSMAIQFPARVRVAVVSVFCMFQFAANAAASEPDRVSLRESTIAWSTAKYATDSENGLVDGSLDTRTIVDRSFKTYVI
jgi:hypothetical protein